MVPLISVFVQQEDTDVFRTETRGSVLLTHRSIPYSSQDLNVSLYGCTYMPNAFFFLFLCRLSVIFITERTAILAVSMTLHTTTRIQSCAE